VGIEARYLRRALGEVRAELMIPDLPTDREFLQRLGGHGFVRASRVVPRPPGQVEEELERHLSEREALDPVRKRAGRSLWEPAGGFLAGLQRGLIWMGGRYDLSKAASIEVVLSPLEDGFTLVTLTADLRNQRSEQVGGGGGVAGFVGAGGGLALGIGAGMPWLAVPGLIVGAGFGGWLGRREYRKQVDRMELSLEGLLDRLEAGEPLAPPGRRASRFLDRL
jgi:hypothetical protein